MKKYTVGIIRVLSTENEEIKYKHGKIIERSFPMFKTKTFCIENQPEGINSKAAHDKAVPKIINLGLKISQEVDGIIISCAEDPAVKELDNKLDIPVIGPGRAASVTSIFYGEKIAVLSLLEDIPSVYKDILKDKLIGIIYNPEIKESMDLVNKNKLNKLIEKVNNFESNFDVLTLSCTGMSTVGVSDILRKKFKIPVIDPLMSAGLYMYYSLKKGGI